MFDFDFKEEHMFARAARDGCYEADGWVALANEETDHAALMTFGHCSCFCTWESLNGDSPVWDGTIAEMVALASENRDPSLPLRVREEGDRTDSLLDELYEEIRGWALAKK